MKNLTIVIIGATGLVGSEIINILECSNFEFDNLYFVASESSSGEVIKFRNINMNIISLDRFIEIFTEISSIDMLFLCASSEISERYIYDLSKKCKVVIDKTEFLRDKAPLIVPEVNSHIMKSEHVFSSPNCVAIPLSIALNQFKKFIKRVVVSTYQSMSGAGANTVNKFTNETIKMLEHTKSEKDFRDLHHNYDFAFNIIPNIGVQHSNQVFSEETKVIQEVKKILNEDIKISITCVRVPSIIGHSMSVNVELNDDFYEIFLQDDRLSSKYKKFLYEQDMINTSKLSQDMNHELIDCLHNGSAMQLFSCDNHFGSNLFEKWLNFMLIQQNGLIINQDCAHNSAKECLTGDSVIVSRLRQDFTLNFGFSMWICCDNLRKGAALNAVQVAHMQYTALATDRA